MKYTFLKLYVILGLLCTQMFPAVSLGSSNAGGIEHEPAQVYQEVTVVKLLPVVNLVAEHVVPVTQPYASKDLKCSKNTSSSISSEGISGLQESVVSSLLFAPASCYSLSVRQAPIAPSLAVASALSVPRIIRIVHFLHNFHPLPITPYATPVAVFVPMYVMAAMLYVIALFARPEGYIFSLRIGHAILSFRHLMVMRC